MLEIRLPPKPGGLMMSPVHRDPTLPHPQGRFLDLIEATPKPALNLDQH
jgi:hypothetical protein